MRDSPVSPLGPADFGEDYYLHEVGGRPYRKDEAWLAFFTPIAERIVSTIKPRRVLDAGCAMGLLVELLRERGVEAYGLDLSPYAIAHVPESVKSFCWTASVQDELRDDFDLIVCVEVFPHVMPADADAAIANFCRHARAVLFSSMPFVDPSARRHVNFNGPGDFAATFARRGFYRDCSFDASVIRPWAALYRPGPADVALKIAEYENFMWAERLRLDETRLQLQQARQRIDSMERSWFWRARTPWARLTGR